MRGGAADCGGVDSSVLLLDVTPFVLNTFGMEVKLDFSLHDKNVKIFTVVQPVD
jgi:hypothetical protein